MLAINWDWQWRRMLISQFLLFFVSAHSADISAITPNYFLSKLMSKYGDGNELPFEGFEHLVHGLGLGGDIVFDHDIECHKTEVRFVSLHSHHNHYVLGGGSLTKNCSKPVSRGHGGYEHVIQHDRQEHETHDHTHGHDHEHESHEHTHGHDHDQNIDIHHENHEKEHNHDHHDHGHSSHDHKHNHDHSEYQTNDKVDNVHKISFKQSQKDEHKHSPSDSQQKSKKRKDRIRTGHPYMHITRSGKKSKTINERNSANSTMSSSQPPVKHSIDDTTAELDHTHVEHKNNTEIIRYEETTSDDTHHRENRTLSGEYDEDKDVIDGSEHKSHRKGPSEKSDSTDPPHSINKRHVIFDECLSVSDMLRLVNLDLEATISKETFKELCPTLIYQIDTDACHRYHTMHDKHASAGHDHDHDHAHSHAEHEPSNATFGFQDVPAKVWGYSSLAVLIISLVGLLGVAVIPIMQRMFYQQLLHFLVAMAVGALSGDALLHLLPHALSGGHGSHSHGEDAHAHDNSSIFKCLCGLMGIYGFYIMERCLVILSTFRKMKKKTMAAKPAQTTGSVVNITETDDEEQMMQLSKEPLGYHHDNTKGTGHGHGHSHSMDGAPGSVAAVAWMVIMGDGIHNFCDGLAIGAAFVSSITGGFSTSVAVFCHELPHEIGDFAMLLKAGMTIKQAIFYNCVSSILCFIGMLVGVAVGNIAGASLWVFVVVAGMFLYIALVDMLPELTSGPVDKTKDAFIELFLQIIGMLIGAGIMLLIALYEEKLQTILD